MKKLVIAILLLTLLIGGCNKVETNNSKEKVLVIGVDAMDPKVTKKLMDEGKLPNFEKLNFKPLATSNPPQSPVAWVTLATGTNPGKHNVFDFIRRNPESQLPELGLSKQIGHGGMNYETWIGTPTFWKIASEAGVSARVLRWPMTFPAEEISEHLLSGLGVPDVKGFLSGYTFYTDAEFDKKSEGAEKIIPINIEDGMASTVVRGPNKATKEGVQPITVDMNIEVVEGGAILQIGGEIYEVKEQGWTDWIRLKFKTGLLKETHGTAKAYLKSTSPFSLYLTTINIDPENPVVDISYPKKFSRELANNVGIYYTLGIQEDTDALNDGKLDDDSFMEQVADIEEQREKMFWQDFNDWDKGLYGIVFDSGDRVQHMFWDDRRIDDDGEIELHKHVEDYWVDKDRLIGEVLEKIDDDTKLIIVSDHGISSFERAVSVNTWLWQNGFMELKQEPSEDDEGALFKFVDWENTRAYSVGFNSIYINVEGREKHGSVDPMDREKVVQEIVEMLENLEDPGKDNKSVVMKAWTREEAYSGDNLDKAPDILVGYREGYRAAWQTAIGGMTPEVFADNDKHWRGDHLVDPRLVPGVIFTNFEYEKEEPIQEDLAPTVLKFLGVELPEHFDGEPLQG